MKPKEFKEIKDELTEWNKLKEQIRNEVNIISVDNYDENSIVFRLLKVEKKKDKKTFVNFLTSSEERVFNATFSAMHDYFQHEIEKEYIKIEDIPLLENITGIIKDRIKSNQERIECRKKDYVKHQKQLAEEKNYEKIRDLNSELFWDKDRIEESEKEILKYDDILQQLKWDIKRLVKKQNVKKAR